MFEQYEIDVKVHEVEMRLVVFKSLLAKQQSYRSRFRAPARIKYFTLGAMDLSTLLNPPSELWHCFCLKFL